MRNTQREAEIARGRSRLPVGSLMWDLIPGPWEHDLSQGQSLSHLATQVPPVENLLTLSAFFPCLFVCSKSFRVKYEP